jgi:hypothetical protein
MNTKTIIFTVIVLVVLYFAYYYFFSSKTDQMLVKMNDARAQKVISAGSLPSGASSNYTFSIWVFVNDWNYRYGQSKVIFARKDQDGGVAPMVEFTPSVNNIHVTLATYPTTGSNTTGKNHTCTLDDVPLQRWTNLIMSINDRALDLYLDGKLVRTCLLPGVPKMNPASNIFVTPDGGFSGFVSNFRYIADSVNPSQAYNIYKEGFGGSSMSNLFNKYRVKFAFVKDNKEVNSFEI